MIYALDTNVFIEAARRYYAFDLAPGFWDALNDLVSAQRICSIDRVDAEIREDSVREWIDNGGFANGFASTDSVEVALMFGQVMTWVNQQVQFTNAAKAEFASGADGWLIAYSKLHNLSLVTHEVLRLDVKRKVPIPNVCQAFSVPYVDTFDMLRALSISLRR